MRRSGIIQMLLVIVGASYAVGSWVNSFHAAMAVFLVGNLGMLFVDEIVVAIQKGPKP